MNTTSRASLILTGFLTLAAPGCDSDDNGNGDAGGNNGNGDGGFVDAGGNNNGDGGPQNCGQLEATIRDFKIDHPDFEIDGNSDVSRPGLVEPTLGANGKPVYAPDGPVFPHTSSAANFDQWYTDVPGVNMAYPYTITLTQNANGTFGFASSAFFPIDGTGFGNEGNPHNFHFTTEVHTTFKYAGGETFTFTGDDDLWLFINNKLAIDLGGIHPQLSATVDLDAKAAELGISPGGTYKMDIFHAERHTTDSNFKVETSIDCFIIP